MAARRQKGICAEVREVRWQVSEHVGHLRKHPEEYTAALLGFLKSCTTAPRREAHARLLEVQQCLCLK